MLKKLALAAGSVLFAANLMAATPAKAPHVSWRWPAMSYW